MSEAAMRKLPVALIAAVAAQAIAGLMWAGGAAARIGALEDKVGEQRQVTERLARLEEQSLALRATLDRIEWQLEDR